jgi:AcrR family transcriptional regulator
MNRAGIEGDRRSQRTRRALVTALMALILEKSYRRISIREILERADVGRSTFYAHYKNKDDLLAGSFEMMVRHLDVIERGGGGASRSASGGPLAASASLLPTLAFLHHVAHQRKLFRALVRGHGVDLILKRCHVVMTDIAAERLALAHPAAARSPRLLMLAHATAGAFIALFKWWLETDTPCSAEEVDRTFAELMAGGAGLALGAKLLGRTDVANDG